MRMRISCCGMALKKLGLRTRTPRRGLRIGDLRPQRADGPYFRPMSGITIRALIVDDEELARENLRLMLAQECPQVEVVGTADGVESAQQLIAVLDPDLLLLDIRMPSGAEGLDLLEDLPELRALVVFVTAFKDYAVQAFHAN